MKKDNELLFDKNLKLNYKIMEKEQEDLDRLINPKSDKKEQFITRNDLIVKESHKILEAIENADVKCKTDHIIKSLKDVMPSCHICTFPFASCKNHNLSPRTYKECGHTVCFFCFSKMSQSEYENRHCPMCRKEFGNYDPPYLVPNFALMDIIESLNKILEKYELVDITQKSKMNNNNNLKSHSEEKECSKSVTVGNEDSSDEEENQLGVIFSYSEQPDLNEEEIIPWTTFPRNDLIRKVYFRQSCCKKTSPCTNCQKFIESRVNGKNYNYGACLLKPKQKKRESDMDSQKSEKRMKIL